MPARPQEPPAARGRTPARNAPKICLGHLDTFEASPYLACAAPSAVLALLGVSSLTWGRSRKWAASFIKAAPSLRDIVMAPPGISSQVAAAPPKTRRPAIVAVEDAADKVFSGSHSIAALALRRPSRGNHQLTCAAGRHPRQVYRAAGHPTHGAPVRILGLRCARRAWPARRKRLRSRLLRQLACHSGA